jgi:hypothetical protein
MLLRQTIGLYQELKLIEALLNSLNAGAMFPILILDMAYLCTTTLFAMISLNGSLSAPLILLNIILLSDSLVIHFVVYGEAGNVNQVSERIRETLKHSVAVQKDKKLRRKARACNSLKIHVGRSGNYIEKLTPMTITMFSLEQAISLVLLSK